MVEQLQQTDQAQAASVGGLVFEDEEHNTHTLQSLNKMRKNRHFCDVILHVCTAAGKLCSALLLRF
jgi:influenza virus NS1A-binding protein